MEAKDRLNYSVSMEGRERRKYRRKANVKKKTLKIVSHPKIFSSFF